MRDESVLWTKDEEKGGEEGGERESESRRERKLSFVGLLSIYRSYQPRRDVDQIIP